MNTIILSICLMACYDFTEYNELDSVKEQGRLKLMSSKHLLQKLMLKEAIHNETVIYITNLIIGTLFFLAVAPLNGLLKGDLLPYLPLLIIIEMGILLVGSNIISGKIDERYDKKWLKQHENEIKKSAQDNKEPLKL